MCPDKNKKTILLTGAAGYVGSHTTVEVLNLGHDVIALDNCVNAYKGPGQQKPHSILAVEKLTGKSITYYDVDMLKEEDLLAVFKKHKIDVVIHLAALKAVGESVNEPLKYYKNNMIGCMNLIEVMNKTNTQNLVFSSSATVYGRPQYLPMDEEHPTGQGVTNPYGQTKQMCEQIMKDVAHANKNFNVIVLRYFNPVGAHKSGEIGENPKGKPNNLMPFVAQVAVGKRPLIEVFGSDFNTSDGTGVRDYIHVVDLAKGHVAAIDKILEDGFPGYTVYNLGTGMGVSVLEMIDAYSKACGRQLPYKLTERRAGDVGTVVAKCSLAEKELGWKATKSLQEMCADSWKWQSLHTDGFETKK